jgi:hypothetical protein
MFLILGLLQTILIFACGWKVYRSSQDDLFHLALLFLLTYWYLYGLKPLVLQDFLYSRFPEELIFYGWLLTLAGLAAFYLGCSSGLPRSLALALPQPPARWPRGALFPYAVLLFLAGAVGEAVFIGRSGGFAHFFSMPRGAGDYQGNTAYLYNLRWLSVPGSAIIMVEILRNGLPGIKKLLGLGLIACALTYFFLLGQRSAMLTFGLMLAAAWFYAHRALPGKALRLFFILLPFFLAIGLIGLFRSEFHLHSTFPNLRAFSQQRGPDMLTGLGRNLFFTGSEPDNPHQEPVLYLSVLSAVPHRVDYDYGKPYLHYLVHWIPRLWWVDKPNYRLEGAKRLERAMRTDLQGPVLTVLGYFYANLGLTGIFLGMFLTGVGLSAIYLWFKARPGSAGALLIYLLLLPYGIGTVFSPGIFAGWDTLLPFYLVPAWGGFWYLRISGGLPSAKVRRFRALDQGFVKRYPAFWVRASSRFRQGHPEA